jgi:hypothetical protein
MRGHYEYSKGRSRTGTGPSAGEVRALWDERRAALERPPSEAERNGRIEGSGDELPRESDPSLW